MAGSCVVIISELTDQQRLRQELHPRRVERDIRVLNTPYMYVMVRAKGLP